MQYKHLTVSHFLPIVCAAMGLAFFFIVYDARILDPEYIQWIMKGDAAQHYLGWQFFRNEAWSLPLGAINNYLYPHGTSLVFTDAIPLLALILKPFSSLLSTQFQYTGIWLLLVYLLQGYFSALVLAKVTSNKIVICLGSMLFTMNIILLDRAGGHEALTGHWLIIAALNLYFLRFNLRTTLYWLVLIVTAALVHFYLLFMVLAIWFAYLMKENIDGHWLQLSNHAKLTTGTLIVLLLVMWMAGYFVITTKSATGIGFGFYSMNLLAPFNPPLNMPLPFLKGYAYATDGQYEGKNYLGFGCILLIIIATYDFFRSTKINLPKKHYGLVLVSSVLVLLAISNKVTFGKDVLFEIPLPDMVFTAVSILRSSGRLFWPVSYILVIAAIAIITRSSSTRYAAIVMTCIVSLQLIDFYPVFKHFNITWKTYETPLKSPKWSKIASQFKHLAIIPPNRQHDNYIPFALLASEHQMTLNIGSTARTDHVLRAEYRKKLINDLTVGKHQNDTLYVFQESATWLAKKLPPHFKTMEVDGFLIAGYPLDSEEPRN